MSKLPIVDMQGASAGEFDVPDELLVLDRGDQAVHDAVVAHLARRRAGTASTRGKGAVRGSNRKPWRQKGTGRARAGCRRSPVWRGGGVAHGPHPRSFHMRIPRKAARLAFRRVFSGKVASGEIRVLVDLAVPEGKTKLLAGALRNLGIQGGALLVVDRVEQNLSRASRNIRHLEVATAKQVSVYQLLRHSRVLATRPAMEDLVARCRSSAGEGA